MGDFAPGTKVHVQDFGDRVWTVLGTDVEVIGFCILESAGEYTSSSVSRMSSLPSDDGGDSRAAVGKQRWFIMDDYSGWNYCPSSRKRGYDFGLLSDPDRMTVERVHDDAFAAGRASRDEEVEGLRERISGFEAEIMSIAEHLNLSRGAQAPTIRNEISVLYKDRDLALEQRDAAIAGAVKADAALSKAEESLAGYREEATRLRAKLAEAEAEAEELDRIRYAVVAEKAATSDEVDKPGGTNTAVYKMRARLAELEERAEKTEAALADTRQKGRELVSRLHRAVPPGDHQGLSLEAAVDIAVAYIAKVERERDEARAILTGPFKAYHDTLDAAGEVAGLLEHRLATLIADRDSLRRERDELIASRDAALDSELKLKDERDAIQKELREAKQLAEGALNAQTESEKKAWHVERERDDARAERDRLQASHEDRRSRVSLAISRLREGFKLRPDCSRIEDAVEDAVAAMNAIVAVIQRYDTEGDHVEGDDPAKVLASILRGRDSVIAGRDSLIAALRKERDELQAKAAELEARTSSPEDAADAECLQDTIKVLNQYGHGGSIKDGSLGVSEVVEELCEGLAAAELRAKSAEGQRDYLDERLSKQVIDHERRIAALEKVHRGLT